MFVRAERRRRPPTIPRRVVSIRSRVHEYGGGAVCLVPGGATGSFAYVDKSDQRVWHCNGPSAAPGSAAPRPLSAPAPEGSAYRHGGLSATADGRWVLAVGPHGHQAAAAAQHRRPHHVGSKPMESTLLDGHELSSAPLGGRGDGAPRRRGLGAPGHAMGRLGTRRRPARSRRLPPTPTTTRWYRRARPGSPPADRRSRSGNQPGRRDGRLRFVRTDGGGSPTCTPARPASRPAT